MKLYELWPLLKDGDCIKCEQSEMLMKHENHLLSVSGIKLYGFTPEFAFDYDWRVIEPF